LIFGVVPRRIGVAQQGRVLAMPRTRRSMFFDMSGKGGWGGLHGSQMAWRSDRAGLSGGSESQ